MPKAIYHGKGKRVTKSTYEKRFAQQKSGEKRRKNCHNLNFVTVSNAAALLQRIT
jgi:hypothetical protein